MIVAAILEAAKMARREREDVQTSVGRFYCTDMRRLHGLGSGTCLRANIGVRGDGSDKVPWPL